jgi:hypothetical protein
MALYCSGISMRAASAKLGSGKRVLVTLWKSTNWNWTRIGWHTWSVSEYNVNETHDTHNTHESFPTYVVKPSLREPVVKLLHHLPGHGRQVLTTISSQ